MRGLLTAGLVITILAGTLHHSPVLPPQTGPGRLRWLLGQYQMLWALSRRPDLLPGPARTRSGWLWGSSIAPGPNCLAWAINRRDGHYDPGNRARIFRSDQRAAQVASSPAELMALLELDGLCPLTEQNLRLVPDGWVVALYVRGEHYHLLRRDSDGRWSDKPGGEQPRLLHRGRMWLPVVHVQRNPFAVLRFAGLWLVDPVMVDAARPFVISAGAARALGTTRIPDAPRFP